MITLHQKNLTVQQAANLALHQRQLINLQTLKINKDQDLWLANQLYLIAVETLKRVALHQEV